MDALGFIGSGGGFGFEHGETFQRLRAGEVVDPYNPDEPTREDWSNPSVLILPNAYLASQASSVGGDAVREPLTTTDQLIIPDPLADVVVGDRIRRGARSWSVTGFPAADKNPFNGWRPTLVVNLEEATG
jgi:hypothetical protein